MSARLALIIANTEYDDPGLATLIAPGKDAEDFSRVLQDKEICAFDEVSLLLNQPEYILRGAIDVFFDQKKPDDLLLLYFSGHGVRDELGSLYLAVKNTIRSRLRSTAIKSDFIREAMDQSRSRRQVLIMDCCNSGAFSQGMKAATGVSIGTASSFEPGYGRIILTASDATQYAWEGDKVIGETDNSLFTHFLVEGLGGHADLNGDGHITVDELYDYAYEKVKLATPKQTPSKFSSKQQGEIVLRQNMRTEDIKPAALPTALLDSLENPFSDVRLGAVQQLIKLLNGKNLGLARSAREVLEKIEREDDSRTVSRAAFQALELTRQAERMKLQKSEEERPVPEKEKAGQFEKQQVNVVQSAFDEGEANRKARAEQRARVAAKIQNAVVSIKSVVPQGIKSRYWVTGAVTFLVLIWVFLPQLVYASSKSIDQRESLVATTESIRIKNNINYEARRLFLNGIAFDVEIKTTRPLKDQPLQVILYFEHADNLITAPRSFTTFFSPYLSKGNYVSVYANVTPDYDHSTFDVKLFIPYSTFAGSGLSENALIHFYADLYTGEDRILLARSASQLFRYTK